MAVYDINGSSISSVYDADGNGLSQVYDIDSNPLIPVPPVTGSVKVMTYNIQEFSGRNGNQTMQQRIIDTYDADIIGLQEVTKGSSMPDVGTAVLTDYPYIHLGAQTNKTGIASKYQLYDVSAHLYETSASETRGYQKGYFEINGKTIAIFTTHLEVKGGNPHIAQALEFFNALQNEEYFIALGDFNVECHDKSDPEYTSVVKQFIDAGYNLSNWTDETGFVDTWFNQTTVEGSSWKCPCDNIITSSNIDINNIVYDPIKLEYTSGYIDHIAVIAELTIH